jgi:hypothetical protein
LYSIVRNTHDGVHGKIFDSKEYPIKGYLQHNSLTYYEYRDEDDYPWLHVIFVEDIFDHEKGKQYQCVLKGKEIGHHKIMEVGRDIMP